MRLAGHPLLDALCGEYLLGTLRGAARRRFEHALEREPAAAARLAHWQAIVPRYSAMIEIEPPARVWQRLERELGLGRYRTPWYQRVAPWRAWAAAATAALLLTLGLQLAQREDIPEVVTIAQLAGKDQPPAVTAQLSRDGRTLVLRATRPIVAGPGQSYELWVIPAEGGAPISVAVLGSLDARFAVPPAHAPRLRTGATLAVSVEPAGGSPTGRPTGPVILAGKIAG
jgi:anti-sigma-K factor RskA